MADPANTNIDDPAAELRQKLEAGQNDNQKGYRNFATAQYYNNLTKEQYSGVNRTHLSTLSASRDKLNPFLNTENLKLRLETIEYYKNVNGHERNFWPHYAMKRFGRYAYRYKFNLAVKGFAAYLIYNDLAQRKHMNSTRIMTLQQHGQSLVNISFHTGCFLGVSALI